MPELASPESESRSVGKDGFSPGRLSDSPTGQLGFCAACGSPTEERDVEGSMRPVCLACGQVVFLDPKLAVGVLIARDGRILLGKRGPGTREPGKWSFPAGFVERGERVEHAAAREAREETNLDVEIGDLIGLYSSEGETVVLAVYAATAAAGDPEAGDDLVEIGWFSVAELPELAFPRDRHIMEAWLSSQRVMGR
ncbi:MAG: NUDIX domain-containing protein [Chloroflexi bacterium]|nr:NUDIX domain-containing protein [Chloroflexota bacterium]